MRTPPLTGHRSVQVALLLLVTTLVVTGGCVSLLNGPDESSAKTPDAVEPDQSPGETGEESDADSPTSVETQATAGGTGSDAGGDSAGSGDGPDSTATASSTSPAESQLDYVPASANAIVTVDPSLLTHESTVTLANGSESTYEWNYSDIDAGNHSLFDSTAETDVSSYRETIELYEQQLGINVSEVHSVTFVSGASERDRESRHHDYIAIVETELGWETVHDTLTNKDGIDGEFVERSYSGVTLYQVPKHGSADGTHARETWVADFENGAFAVGSREQVEQVVDTHEGETAAVSGALRDEAAAAEGLVTAVANMTAHRDGSADDSANAGLSGNVETVVVEYDPGAETVRLDTTLVTPGQEEADQVESMLAFALASQRTIDDPEKAAIAEEIFEATVVDATDNRVQFSFEMDAERVNELVDRAEDLEQGE